MKIMGNRIYCHRDYEQDVVPQPILAVAKGLFGNDSYNCIRYDKKTCIVAFQYSSDFDTSHEPRVCWTVAVSPDGTIKRTVESDSNPHIWHHKWMWVDNNYNGFNVQESKERSKQWEPYVTKEEKRKIGLLSFWNKIRKRWE